MSPLDNAAQQSEAGLEPGSTAELILERAAGLFARKGFAATSIREIVEASGVTKPTLYYYFESKEGLIQRIIQAAMDGFIARLDQAEGPLEPALQSFVRDTLGFARMRPSTIQLLCRIQQAAPQEVEADIERMRALGMTRFGALFQAAIDSGEIAPRDPQRYTIPFLGGLISLMDAVARGRTEGAPEDVADDYIQLFFSGARAQKEQPE